MHSTVADCITTLLSRKAKLKGENPPPAKPYISTFLYKSHWMGVHYISFSVCLPTTYCICFSSLRLPDCHFSSSSLPFCWSWFIFLSLCLFVFCLSGVLAAFLFVCLLAHLPVLVFQLSVCHLNASPICHVCAATQEDITLTLSWSNHLTNVLFHISPLSFSFTSLLKCGLLGISLNSWLHLM